MSAITLKGDPKMGGIPRKATVVVVCMTGPHRSEMVFKDTVSKSLTLDLDPGRYQYIVRKQIDKRNGIKYLREFYHEMTPEQWKRIVNISPTLMNVRHTTKGVNYSCKYIGCDFDTNSRPMATMHGAEHQGINLLGVENPAVAAEQVNEGAKDYAQKAGIKGRGEKIKQVLTLEG